MEVSEAVLFGGLIAVIAILVTLSKQLDKLITEIRYLRIEQRTATGVEPAGMTLAREKAEERRAGEELDRIEKNRR